MSPSQGEILAHIAILRGQIRDFPFETQEKLDTLLADYGRAEEVVLQNLEEMEGTFRTSIHDIQRGWWNLDDAENTIPERLQKTLTAFFTLLMNTRDRLPLRRAVPLIKWYDTTVQSAMYREIHRQEATLREILRYAEAQLQSLSDVLALQIQENAHLQGLVSGFEFQLHRLCEFNKWLSHSLETDLIYKQLRRAESEDTQKSEEPAGQAREDGNAQADTSEQGVSQMKILQGKLIKSQRYLEDTKDANEMSEKSTLARTAELEAALIEGISLRQSVEDKIAECQNILKSLRTEARRLELSISNLVACKMTAEQENSALRDRHLKREMAALRAVRDVREKHALAEERVALMDLLSNRKTELMNSQAKYNTQQESIDNYMKVLGDGSDEAKKGTEGGEAEEKGEQDM